MNLSLFIILFNLLYLNAKAQECYNPAELQLTTCKQINYPVYPLDLNVSQNEALAYEIISKVNSLSFILSQECIQSVSRYTCGYYYPSCNNGTKVKPCMEMCEDVNTKCGKWFGILPETEKPLLQFLNCSQLDSDGSLKFSEDSQNCYTLDNNTDSSSGGCQVYEPSLSPLSSTTCAPFVSSEIYYAFPSSNSQSLSDQIANQTIWLVDKMYPILPVGCYKHLVSLLCQTAYPSCNRVTDNSGEVKFSGLIPCNSFCQETMLECANFAELIGQQFVNCSMTNGDGNLLWPEGSSSSCSVSLFPSLPSAKDFQLREISDCPSVLAKKINPSDSDSQCWLPCPDPTYSNKMWNDLNIIILVCSSLSFALSFFLLISTLLNAKKRKLHIHISVYFSVFVQSISFLINGTKPQEGTWCDDSVTFATNQTNDACGAQAFLFQMFTLACLCWWLVMSLHMFFTVVLEKKMILKNIEWRYHAFAWGVPLVLTIITAATKNHSFGPPTPFCFIHPASYVNNYDMGKPFILPTRISMDYFVFYIPIGLCLAAAVVMLVMVFVKIFKTLQAAKSYRDITKADLGVQNRVMLFVILLFIIFVLMFEQRFDLESDDVDKMKYNDFLYVICQVKNDLGIEFNDWCLDEELPYRVSYPHIVMVTFLASSFGWIVFVAFGTDATIYRWWFTLLRMGSLKEKIAFIKDGKETTRRSVPTAMTTTTTTAVTHTSTTTPSSAPPSSSSSSSGASFSPV